MKNVLLAALFVCFAFLTSATAEIAAVELISAKAGYAYMAENTEDSDCALFKVKIEVTAGESDVYIPLMAKNAMDWEIRYKKNAEILNIGIIEPTIGDVRGWFQIEAGDSRRFILTVYTTATANTPVQLRLSGIYWTSRIGEPLNLYTNFEKKIQTDQIYLNCGNSVQANTK